jgi:hypothetical protein
VHMGQVNVELARVLQHGLRTGSRVHEDTMAVRLD